MLALQVRTEYAETLNLSGCLLNMGQDNRRATMNFFNPTPKEITARKNRQFSAISQELRNEKSTPVSNTESLFLWVPSPKLQAVQDLCRKYGISIRWSDSKQCHCFTWQKVSKPAAKGVSLIVEEIQ